MVKDALGFVFDIQRYTLHDGPGIRTAVFLQGCPLRCVWCHSPESWSVIGEIAWLPMRCVGVEKCGQCLKVCRSDALDKTDVVFSEITKENIRLVNLDWEKCTKCGQCARVCSRKAHYQTAKKMSINEVVSIVMKDEIYFRRTSGGVTVSGGEPMMQVDFVEGILKACKIRGLHTALDTSGFAEWEKYDQISKFVDLFLFDLKHMDSDSSLQCTGVRNELILDNLSGLANRNASIQIRIPIIPGFNDSEKNLKDTANMCKSLRSSVKLVQLLPYHRLGSAKYDRIGKKYALSSVEVPSKLSMELHKNFFESHGLRVQLG